MKNSIQKLLICLLFLFSLPISASTCGNFIKSDRLQNQVSNFKLHLQNNINVWSGYNINKEIVIFTDLINAPKCYVVLYDGNILISGFSEEVPKIPNTIYNFLYLNRSNIPEDISKQMIRLNKSEAMIFSLHNWEFIPQYIKALVGEHALVFNMIVHEGFHLFYQRRSNVDPSSNLLWPIWLEHPQQEKVVENCYHKPKIINQYYKEANALTRSAKLMYIIKDKIAAIEAAKDFISFRDERYEKIKTNNFRVPLMQGSSSISCRLAEDSLEIDEGVTNFIGTQTTLDLNLITDFQFIEYSNLLDFNPYFYSAAQLQLYLLSNLVPEITFNDIKSRLSSSPDFSVTVYSIFKEIIERY